MNDPVLTRRLIERISETDFRVLSDTGLFYYDVSFRKGVSVCSCPDFLFRRLPNAEDCKHIERVIRAYPEVLEFVPKAEIKPRTLSEIMIESGGYIMYPFRGENEKLPGNNKAQGQENKEGYPG